MENKYKKFKCEKCGTKYKVKNYFNFCPTCGCETDMMLTMLPIPQQPDLKRQWLEALGPGWPYEVRKNKSNCTALSYFSKYNEYDKPEFVGYCSEIGKFGSMWDYFYPLGTPLDYAPDWPTHIEINDKGLFRLGDSDNYFFRITIISSWPKCPEGMKGKTLKIPEEWRQTGDKD